MDEPALAGIDAHVIDPAAEMEMQPEEHQITGLQPIERDPARGVPLLIGGTWYVYTDAPMHIDDESAAIEAPDIRTAEMIGLSHEFGSGVRNNRTAISTVLRRTGNAGAAGDQRHRQRHQREGAPGNSLSSFRRPDSRAPSALKCQSR